MADADGYLEWNPAEMLEGLMLESQALGIGNPVETATNIIKDGAPAAARSIMHMAVHSKDERVRLRAAIYVMDKATVGRMVEDSFAELIKQMQE